MAQSRCREGIRWFQTAAPKETFIGFQSQLRGCEKKKALTVVTVVTGPHLSPSLALHAHTAKYVTLRMQTSLLLNLLHLFAANAQQLVDKH